MGRFYRFFPLKMALKSFFAHLGVEKLGFRGGKCPKNGFFFLFFFFFPRLVYFSFNEKNAPCELWALIFLAVFWHFGAFFVVLYAEKSKKWSFFGRKSAKNELQVAFLRFFEQFFFSESLFILKTFFFGRQCTFFFFFFFFFFGFIRFFR
jgi:hypothetical protein